MNAQTERFTIAGPAGALEVARDAASGEVRRGVAVIAHPHPQFGGTLDNKVVQTVARAFVLCGWDALRFNFRGIGASEGDYDNGLGEQADMLAVVAHATADAQPAPALALAGFSFGSYVCSHVAVALAEKFAIEKIVFVGTAASRFEVATLPAALHERALVVHGEHDDTVPLAAVLDWARPQSLPVTVVPGGGHFFHGQLPLLKQLVVRHLRA
ncbi:MAG: alpha/beta hydrolase [Pseudomonadota bacterium]